ncbi:MAG: hypothetical protein LBG96_08965 [Tannerella sp.]|jgi:ATP-binding cassette subfamily B protein|nr:hypothetical protein [Tannerella sp.]
MNTLKILQHYMGARKALLPLSMILSALSALAGMLPYILIWLIVKNLFAAKGVVSSAKHRRVCGVSLITGIWSSNTP